MAFLALPAYMGASRSTADLLSLVWLLAAGVGLPIGLAYAVRRVGLRRSQAASVARAAASEAVVAQAAVAPEPDTLTDIVEEGTFTEELAKQIELAQDGLYAISLAILDIDELARTNGELGQEAGDKVIASITRLIKTQTRSDDLAFRLDGDEFAVIMPRCSAGRAQSVMRRLLLAALEEGDSTRDWYESSFSAGISSFPELSGSPDRMHRDAKAALLWAKMHGRTDVQLFDQFRDLSDDELRNDRAPAAPLADEDFTSDGQSGTPIQLRFLGTPDEEPDADWVDPRLVTIGLAEPPA